MRQNHVPLRTCVACRNKGPQRDFVRITRDAGSNFVAGTAREIGGRGAYLCRKLECFEKGLDRGGLGRSLRGRGSDRSRAGLLAWATAEFAAAATSS